MGEDGRIVAQPDQGQPYKGRLKGTAAADVIVGTNANESSAAAQAPNLICGPGRRRRGAAISRGSSTRSRSM
jgi:hypothetical protein